MFHFEVEQSEAEVPETLIFHAPHSYVRKAPLKGDAAVGIVEPYGDIHLDSLKRLFGALIWQSLRDCYAPMSEAGTLRTQLALRAEAVEWFGSRRLGFGTFETACATLEINPDTIRDGLPVGRWREAAMTYVDEGGEENLCGKMRV